ncbi:MAG: RND family transporter [Myxococcales bacterium]
MAARPGQAVNAPTDSNRGLIGRVTAAAAERPWLFVLGALIVTAISVKLASHLEIRSSFQELLPEDLPSVHLAKEMIRRVGGDGKVWVVVESLGGPSGLEHAKALAARLAPEFLAMGPNEIRAVNWTMKPVERWYEAHWPLFLSVADLEKARDTVREEIKKRKIAANPLAMELDDEEPAKTEAPSEWMDPKQPLPRERIAERFKRYDDGFLVHPDRTSVTVDVRPAGTSLSVGDAKMLVTKMHGIVDRHAAEISRDHLKVEFAGSFPLFIAEYEAIINDVAGTAILVVVLVLASILLFFRDVRSVVSLGIPVLIAVAVTFGLTWLVIGYLNTQTAFLGAIVVGNGINYGLIYLARVKQLRAASGPLTASCVDAADTTARATLLASAATSVSFGALYAAANRGFRHFAFIGGIGMLLCWLCTFTLVPALLALVEKAAGAPKLKASADSTRLVPPLQRFFRRPGLIVAIFGVACAIAAALFIRQLPTAMERNLDNLTNDPPKGQRALNEAQARANESFGKSLAGAIALVDSREDADKFCDVIRQRMKQSPWDKLIDGCETMSSIVPLQQPEKLKIIKEIVGEVPDRVLARVDDKVLRDRLREVRDEMAAQKPVTAAEAPPTLLDAFRERDGTLGRIVAITAKGDAHIEVAENLEAFVRGVRDVPVDGKSYDATGENVILADLLTDIEKEGPRTTAISFFGVCVLVFAYFRSYRLSLEVVVSLFLGVVLMCGAAAAIGLKINFFNFIVYPVTFGIAVDYGANVAARVRARGENVLLALGEVGPVVALCSWTSIVGYGTLLYSLNRALRSFGWYAMIGEVMTIITALVLLPALLLVMERARGSGSRP